MLLALDIAIIISQAALVHSHLARLLAQREGLAPDIRQALLLMHSMPRARAGLNLAHMVFRFLILGLLLQLVSRIPGASLLLELGVVLVAAVLYFWLEWIIENRVARDPETWALRFTPFARLWSVGLSPLTAVPRRLTGDLPERNGDGSPVSEEELLSLAEAREEEAEREAGERKMIRSIYELNDTLAREIMVPRIDMNALEVNTPIAEALNTLHATGYSRLPVYEETVDNILGLLYAKDLLRVWREGEQMESLRGLLRPAYFIPEAKKVDELLAEMQLRRVHMAMVVDEYGGIAGLVTLEDIVEEIVGEIQDEFDEGEDLPYEPSGEGEYVFLGRVDLDDFNEIMDCHLPKDEAETLGGFIYNYFGRVPDMGDRVQVDGILLTVDQVSGRRIQKVRARSLLASSADDERENDYADR